MAERDKKRKSTDIKVDVHTMYQLLIESCRYGYTRNNHLMPWGSYDHVKSYLPQMLKIDSDTALHTACQICDECISEQLEMNFYNGLDDEHDNRKKAIEFIEYLLKWIKDNSKTVENSYTNYDRYIPYNYNRYVDNLEREKALRYRVFELDEFDKNAKRIRELTTEPVDKTEADKILFTDELQVTEGTMSHIDLKTDKYPVRVIGELIKIIKPESHKDKIYSIELVREEKKS